jgi:hypothetical protein
MELLNIGFAKLLIKLIISVMPFVIGIVILCLSEDSKRGLRDSFCRAAFGSSGVISYAKFSRTLSILAVFSILIGLVLIWFLVLAGYF